MRFLWSFEPFGVRCWSVPLAADSPETMKVMPAPAILRPEMKLASLTVFFQSPDCQDNKDADECCRQGGEDHERRVDPVLPPMATVEHLSCLRAGLVNFMTRRNDDPSEKRDAEGHR